eukprot:g2242.t1
MPVFVLYVKMQLENVAWVAPSEGARWCLDLESGAERKEGIWVVPDEQHETAGGRSTANFVMTWKESRSEATLNLCGAVPELKSRYTEDDSGSWVAIQAFEARGADVVGYRPGDEWVVAGPSGSRFTEDVDLSEEWCDYDEEAECSPTISEFEFKFETTTLKAAKSKKGKKKR